MGPSRIPDYKCVMAIDPGGTTGMAFRMHDGSFHTAIALTPEQCWDFIDNRVDLVIYENFAAISISKYGIHTLKVIGGIRALCWKNRIPIIQKQPSARKCMLLDSREYLTKTKGDTFVVHEVDALAHLMVWDEDKIEGYLIGSEKDNQYGLPSKNSDSKPRINPKKIIFSDIGKYA